MDQDEKPQDSSMTDAATAARASTSLRMLGLVPGVIIGMVVGVSLDNTLLGIVLGIGIGVGLAALIERVVGRKAD